MIKYLSTWIFVLRKTVNIHLFHTLPLTRCLVDCSLSTLFSLIFNSPLGVALYCTSLYCTTLYCTSLYCIALHSTALHSTALNCTALNGTVLHSTAQNRTLLYSTHTVETTRGVNLFTFPQLLPFGCHH